MMIKEYGYGRSEKLKRKTEIDRLFGEGKWVSSGNLRLIFLEIPEKNGIQMGVSVSKRYFKRAVDRNRIKRLLRECYRLNKSDFSGLFSFGVYAMLFWTSKKMPKNYSETKEIYIKLLEKVKNLGNEDRDIDLKNLKEGKI